MNIPEEFLRNQVFDTRALAFNRQLTPNLTRDPFAHVEKPLGAEVFPDGTVLVRFFGPAAASVRAGHEDTWIDLTKDEDGMWTGLLPYDEPGFKQLAFTVDGVKVLNPLAPIGWGSGSAINYIEIPDPDQDFLLLRDVEHGTVSMEYFPSAVTGETECCYVYTPPHYRDDLEKRYPVLYLQHGGGENEGCWVHLGKVNFLMDNLLAEGKCVPFIIVMNNLMMQGLRTGDPLPPGPPAGAPSPVRRERSGLPGGHSGADLVCRRPFCSLRRRVGGHFRVHPAEEPHAAIAGEGIKQPPLKGEVPRCAHRGGEVIPPGYRRTAGERFMETRRNTEA